MFRNRGTKGFCFGIVVAVVSMFCFHLMGVFSQPVETAAQSAAQKKINAEIEKQGLLKYIASLAERYEKLEAEAHSQFQQINTKCTDLQELVKKQQGQLSGLDGTMTTAGNRITAAETSLKKITNGWFLISSELTGRANCPYILDVKDKNGTNGDGRPGIQLVGEPQANPNRKWRLILLD